MLLTRDSNTNEIIDCVISDFSYACHIDNIDQRLGFPGSVLYMAPEYFAAFLKRENPINNQSELESRIKASDFSSQCWAIGVMLYNLSSSNTPFWFASTTQEELMNHFDSLAIEKVWEERFPEHKDGHPIWHVVRGLLRYDPAKRMTVAQALEEIETCIQLKKFQF